MEILETFNLFKWIKIFSKDHEGYKNDARQK